MNALVELNVDQVVRAPPHIAVAIEVVLHTGAPTVVSLAKPDSVSVPLAVPVLESRSAGIADRIRDAHVSVGLMPGVVERIGDSRPRTERNCCCAEQCAHLVQHG